jgi:glycosyltransferase involved in cell wall biosynthesis
LAVNVDIEVLIAEPGEPFASRVKEALTDGELRRAVASRPRRYVEREHSWDDSAERLLGVYEELAGGGSIHSSRRKALRAGHPARLT